MHLIECRNCDVSDCTGCNLHRLAFALRRGLFDACKDDHNAVCITSEVVQVVRCWECELWNEWDYSGHKELGNFVCSCAHWSNEDGYVVYTKPDDYCSYGDPKE